MLSVGNSVVQMASFAMSTVVGSTRVAVDTVEPVVKSPLSSLRQGSTWHGRAPLVALTT
jgi:hypothetical protein